MVSIKFKKTYSRWIIPFVIILCGVLFCSCSSKKEQTYLEDKYNDTFVKLSSQNRGNYKLTWFESKTYPDLFVEVETDKGNKYFDNYNIELVKRKFSDEICTYIGDCYIYTGDSSVVDTNTNYLDIRDISASPDIISIHQSIFIEENTLSDEEIYKIAQTIRNKYSDIRGTFKFIILKEGSTETIKQAIRKYQTLNNSDYWDYEVKSSKSISFSSTLKLPDFIVFDDYSLPQPTNFWEYK